MSDTLRSNGFTKIMKKCVNVPVYMIYHSNGRWAFYLCVCVFDATAIYA